MAQAASSRYRRPLWFELSIHNADKPDVNRDYLANRLVPHLLPDRAEIGPVSAESAIASFSPFGLLLTSVPTYLQKARIFPGCRFAIGADTIERVAEVRFYDQAAGKTGATQARDRAISEIADLGCRFLVFGRSFLMDRTEQTRRDHRDRANTRKHDSRSRFAALSDLAIPESLRELCDEVTEAEFRVDISSTQLRHRNTD